MILNAIGGNPLLIGDIAATTRTISNPTYQYCDGSIILNPTETIMDNALARGEYALGPAASTASSGMAKQSGPFYDGIYFLNPGTQTSTSYPVIEVWIRGSNGVFTRNGLKVLLSTAQKNPPEYCEQTSPIVKCGGYYYHSFNTTDLKTYIAYTTNPTGTWSIRQVDLSLAGVTITQNEFYCALYTNDSKVRLVVTCRDSSSSSVFYYINYEFSGDTSNITFINTQTQSFSGQYWSVSSLPSRGVKRIGSYYVIGGFSDNFVYKTFTATNWSILEIRSSSYYTFDGIGFDGTYYYVYQTYGSDSSYSNYIMYGTSVPTFYKSPSYSIKIPYNADDFPDTSYKHGVSYGSNDSANGPMVFKYKGNPYILVNAGRVSTSVHPSGEYALAIFRLDTSARTATRVFYLGDSGGTNWWIPDPLRPFQFAVFASSTDMAPRLIGPAVPNLTGVDSRNWYMRIA